MLGKVEAKGLPMAVLSNKPRDFTALALERFLGDVRFHEVVGVGPDVPAKPDPTALLRIIQGLDLAPEEVVLLGDTANDMRAASTAGAFPVGARWGFRPDEELLAHGARWLLNHPLELMGALG